MLHDNEASDTRKNTSPLDATRPLCAYAYVSVPVKKAVKMSTPGLNGGIEMWLFLCVGSVCALQGGKEAEGDAEPSVLRVAVSG